MTAEISVLSGLDASTVDHLLAIGQELYRYGLRQIEMECPTCHEHMQDNWQRLTPIPARSGIDFHRQSGPEDSAPRRTKYMRAREPSITDQNQAISFEVEWMRCANQDCGETIIRMTKQRLMLETFDPTGATPIGQEITTWTAYPRQTSRPVDPLVSEDFRRDYVEAAAILDLSPRASAVLSRRILADLLEQYAGLSDYRLSVRIDKFIADTSHPTHVRDPMHVLRSIADFSAHTKRDKIDQALVINVTREEAEWTLDVLDRFFDHFIVTPARDAAMKAAMNEKRRAAGQDPIPDLPDVPKGTP